MRYERRDSVNKNGNSFEIMNLKNILLQNLETKIRHLSKILSPKSKPSKSLFILLISFFDVEFNFHHFRIYQCFRIASFNKPWFYFVFVLLKVSHAGTQSTDAKSLVKYYGKFAMVCNSWWKMKVLVPVSHLSQ